jgi:acyl dehydratase
MRNPIYLEDMRVGQHLQGPGATVTEDAIIRFALEWDFQPFHVDARAAAQTLFGGLASSGLHSLVLSYRLFREMDMLAGSGLAGLGIDQLRWLAPVKAGDTITVEAEIKSTRPSARKPDRGVAVFAITARNQRDETVLTYEIASLVRRRPAGGMEQAPSE